MSAPTQQQIEAARAWLKVAMDDVLNLSTDKKVISHLERLYPGGWAAFIRANPGA